MRTRFQTEKKLKWERTRAQRIQMPICWMTVRSLTSTIRIRLILTLTEILEKMVGKYIMVLIRLLLTVLLKLPREVQMFLWKIL